MASWKRYTGLIFGWQITASGIFYAIYAVTPFIRSEFGVSALLVGVMLATLTFGYTVCLIPVGSITDYYGEQWVLFLGLIGLGIASIGVALAPSFLVLLAVVFTLGGFYSPAMPGTNKAVFALIPPSHQNLSMGIKQVGVTAGSGISAIMVPWFGATRFGWEAAFLLLACIALVVGVYFKLTYPQLEDENIKRESNIWTHFREPSYFVLISGGFFLGAGLFSTVGYTILYVNEFIETTAVFAGIVLAAAQASGSAGRVISGWIIDNLPQSLSVATAYILSIQAAISTLLLVLVAVITTPTTALIVFALLGFFILGFTGVYFSCIGGLVPQEEIGNATSGGQLALNFGALLSPPTFGYIVDITGYTFAWLSLAVASLIATVLFTTLLFKVRRESNQV